MDPIEDIIGALERLSLGVSRETIEMLQALARGYLARRLLWITPAWLQTKAWRKAQMWYQGGKRNECELYQRDLVEKIIGVPLPKTNIRINYEGSYLAILANPMKRIDAFEWSEDFDGRISIKKEGVKSVYYFNLKFVCDAGGAQIRTLREVYMFIKHQVQIIKRRAKKGKTNKVYFVNILDGDTCYKYMDHLRYPLGETSAIFVGDLNAFQEWWFN